MLHDNIEIDLIPATITDYPVLQNMARFYAYDIARGWGDAYSGAADFPENGLYECEDLKSSFYNDNNKNFLIKINGKLSGFAFVNKSMLMSDIDFNMEHFYIVAQYQGQGIGQKIAFDLFRKFKGKWTVEVIPGNKQGLGFWRKIIAQYTNGNFSTISKSAEELTTVEHPVPYPAIIFIFDTTNI